MYEELNKNNCSIKIPYSSLQQRPSVASRSLFCRKIMHLISPEDKTSTSASLTKCVMMRPFLRLLLVLHLLLASSTVEGRPQLDSLDNCWALVEDEIEADQAWTRIVSFDEKLSLIRITPDQAGSRVLNCLKGDLKIQASNFLSKLYPGS